MDGYVTIGTKLETKSFDAQIEKLERKLEILEKSADESKIPEKFRRSAEETRELNAEIEKTRNQLSDLYRKQAKIDKMSMTNMQNSLNNVGNSISKIIKKVTKWGLAFIGLRSIISLVRQSIGTLSQYDDQMSADIEYMRYALATVLKPVIETVLNIVKQLLFYVGYLAKAWFNVDLFAKASAKDFVKSNKEAKKLSKTLSSFDEMNVLSNNENQNVVAPSFDLSKIEEIKIPKWLVWIKDHGKEIVAIIGLIIGSKILGTGLLGLRAIGAAGIGIALLYTALTGSDIITDIANIIKGLNDLKKSKEEQAKMDEEVHNKTIQSIKDRTKEAEEYEKGSSKMGQYLELLRNTVDMRKKEIGKSQEAREEIKEVLTSYQRLYEKGKLTNEQIEMYADLLEEVSGGATNFSNEVRQSLSTGQYTADFSHFANWWNNNIKKLDTTLTITGVFSSGGGGKGASGSGGGGGFRAKGGIFYPSKLPKLALGGIINHPGSGVPYNGAVIGERGAEAVLPLTDSQQMALLGETIGRYITINANITNTMNGRVISRELQKINNESDFAFNR